MNHWTLFVLAIWLIYNAGCVLVLVGLEIHVSILTWQRNRLIKKIDSQIDKIKQLYGIED